MANRPKNAASERDARDTRGLPVRHPVKTRDQERRPMHRLSHLRDRRRHAASGQPCVACTAGSNGLDCVHNGVSVYTRSADMGIGIREARETLPTLIKRAAYAGEEIRVGSRGTDEVVLVSTRKYAQLRRTLKRLREELLRLRAELAAMPRDESHDDPPFAGLQRALEDGRLRVSASHEPRVRRMIPGFSAESAVSRPERVRIGSRGETEPEHRRTRPRA